MKKLLISLLSLVALTSFAKTTDELVAEYKPIVDGKLFRVHEKASAEYIEANRIDLLNAFNEWKDTEFAKFNKASKVYQKASDAEKQKFETQQRMFARLADIAYAEMSASDACILRIGSFANGFLQANEAVYQRAKSADFITEDVKLPSRYIFQWALFFKDYDVINNLPFAECITINGYINVKLAIIRRLPDISQAIAKCEEIENYYLDNDKAVPTSVQATLASLTKKLVRSKIK